MRRRWLVAGLSLRARLILLVIVSLLPMLGFSLGRQYLAYEESVEAVGERTKRAATRTAAAVELALKDRIGSLRALTLSESLRQGDLGRFRNEAEAVLSTLYPGANIVLLRRDHSQLLNTLRAPGEPLPVRPPTTSTEKVFSTGNPAVSDFYRAAIGARPVIAIDVPIMGADGKVDLMLSLVPRVGLLAEVLRREELPENWVASVFDSQGVIIARSHSADRFVGQKAGDELLAAMQAKAEGRIDYVSREGIRLFTSFVRLPDSGWTVAIGVPVADLQKPALAAAMRTLLVGGVLLLLSVGLAMLVATHIAKPIAASSEAGADPAPRTGLRETDEVARALRSAQRKRRASEAGTEIATTALKVSEAKLQQAQKMEAIGNLTGGMAHDFNNILGVVVGNLELAKPLVEGDSELRELVRESLDAALSGAELTRRLLAFARRQPLQPTHVRLNEVAGGMVRLLGRTLGENIEIALELSPDIWPVLADPAQIESTLVNLATNARDAMPNGGRLKIATANRHLDADYAASRPEVSPGDYAMIEVSDTGKGMPPEVLSRVFEPFFTTKERGRGTGLGLSMVFGFMRQSGGHINVYSEEGKGTTFRLYLPRSATEPEMTDKAAAETIVGGSGETVLVVEDNAALRRVAVRQLRELGYRVLEAENAPAAMTMVERETIDVMFSDVIMPGGMDGFALARQVAERWPKVKIVLASGFSDTHGRVEPGVHVRLLSKPYRRTDMAKALRDALGSGK